MALARQYPKKVRDYKHTLLIASEEVTAETQPRSRKVHLRRALDREYGDANKVHASERDEIPTPTLGGIRLDNLCKPQSGETGNTIEKRSYSCSEEKKRRATVRTVSNATVYNNTETDTTVAKTDVLGPSDATVFENTVPKIIFIKFPTALQQKNSENKEDDRDVLCSVILQRKMASCKEYATALLKGKALLSARNFMTEASVRIERVRKTVNEILDTGAGPNLLKEICLPRDLIRHAGTIKVTRLRSAANTQLEVKAVIRMEVQMRQIIVATGFLIVTNQPMEIILRTAYFDENIKKIGFIKETLMLTG